MSTTVTSALISQYNLAEPAASLLASIPVDDVLASVQTDFDTHEDQRAQLFSLVFDYTADVSGDPESLSEARNSVFEALWERITKADEPGW